jgi:thioredoxin 1
LNFLSFRFKKKQQKDSMKNLVWSLLLLPVLAGAYLVYCYKQVKMQVPIAIAVSPQQDTYMRQQQPQSPPSPPTAPQTAPRRPPPEPRNPKSEQRETAIDKAQYRGSPALDDAPPQRSIGDPSKTNLREQNDNNIAFRFADSRFAQSNSNYKELKQIEKFDSLVMLSNRPVVVVFTMGWCPYCQQILPKLQVASKRNPTRLILVVDGTTNEEMANLHRRYQVSAVPTMVKMSHGKVVGLFNGDISSANSIIDFISAAP